LGVYIAEPREIGITPELFRKLFTPCLLNNSLMTFYHNNFAKEQMRQDSLWGIMPIKIVNSTANIDLGIALVNGIISAGSLTRNSLLALPPFL
jgi:hypothetical protein